MATVRNKAQVNATVSPWIKMRCVETANSPEFASLSDVVSQALSEYIGKYDYIHNTVLAAQQSQKEKVPTIQSIEKDVLK